MSIGCNVCQGTGFVNWPDDVDLTGLDNDETLEWIFQQPDDAYPDFKVCNCCGNGDDDWYGVPGEHYNESLDPPGPNGPYAYNGGLCECH